MVNQLKRGEAPWPKSNDERTVKDWLVQRVHSGMEDDEVLPVVGMCLDFVTLKGKGERMVEGFRYSESLLDRLALIGDDLAEGKPVQYVLKSAHFDGLDLYVNSHVLIPRPETEEMIFAITDRLRKGFVGKILDIGTGSGCIALALKNRMREANVCATDLSAEALKVAQKNADSHSLIVALECSDILSQEPFVGQSFDLVVSNPPYIPSLEKESMTSRVLEHEPALALFVSDSQPLVFYKAIIDHCRCEVLKPGGLMALECHEDFTKSVSDLIETSQGFSDLEVIQDMQGKNRHIIALKNV